MSKRLINLFRDNRNGGCGPKVNVQEGRASLYLYDAIGGFWGISAQDFVQALDGIDAGAIDLHINCPGGDVFDARAMRAALQRHPARVTAHIDGLAASAATWVALAADQVNITQGGFFMIHNSWSMVIGNAEDMRREASLLDKIDEAIIADYKAKTDIDGVEIIQMMADETWMTAEEALEKGFVDEVVSGESKAADFVLDAYQNAPQDLKEPQNAAARTRAQLERRLALFG